MSKDGQTAVLTYVLEIFTNLRGFLSKHRIMIGNAVPYA